MRILDLSVPVNEETIVPSIPSGFADPPVRFETWIEFAHFGFRITRIDMGAHAGTHCDVQYHFIESGQSITDYSVETWVGWAVVMDLRGAGPISVDRIIPYKKRITDNQVVIPVILHGSSDVLTDAARTELISWKPRAIIFGEGVNAEESLTDSLEFLQAGIPMIMNPDHKKVTEVQDNDLIIAAPIKLIGLEAAPVRLLAVRGLAEVGDSRYSTLREPSILESRIAELERKIGQLTIELERARNERTDNLV